MNNDNNYISRFALIGILIFTLLSIVATVCKLL